MFLTNTLIRGKKYLKESYLVLALISKKTINKPGLYTYRVEYKAKDKKHTEDLITDTNLNKGQSVALFYLDETKSAVFPSSLAWSRRHTGMVVMITVCFIGAVLLLIFKKLPGTSENMD